MELLSVRPPPFFAPTFDAPSLSFAVHRPFVSTNHQYTIIKLRSQQTGKMVYTIGNTSDAREFKDAVHRHALAARMRASWPQPDAVKHVAVMTIVFNTGHDCAAADKLVCDGMEGALYHNDRIVFPRLSDLGSDAGKPRVEVTVWLLRSV